MGFRFRKRLRPAKGLYLNLGKKGSSHSVRGRSATMNVDYLDSVRDPKVWNRTKTALEKVGGGAVLEVVIDVAAKVMAELMKPFIGGR